MSSKKKVVVVGGGNGAAVSILALKRNLELFDISAVISMSDSGGSSGRLRQEFGVLPPGDILRGMLAMSKYDYYTLRHIFYEQRFSSEGKLQGHNLGNLFLTLSSQYSDSALEPLQALHEALACVGSVYPVTLDSSHLCAEYVNKKQVRGETYIDRPEQKDAGHTIARVWLEPAAEVYKPAADALLHADYIVFGPGSLYTSIIPNLLVKGIETAILRSRAKLVYILGNGYEAEGENGPNSMAGFVEALQAYVPRKIDMVIYNTEELGPKEVRFYQEKKWGVSVRDIETIAHTHHVIGHRFERDGGGLSKEKLGDAFKHYFV